MSYVLKDGILNLDFKNQLIPMHVDRFDVMGFDFTDTRGGCTALEKPLAGGYCLITGGEGMLPASISETLPSIAMGGRSLLASRFCERSHIGRSGLAVSPSGHQVQLTRKGS